MASFDAFSIRGIRVRIDQSWFIAFFLFAWTLSAGYFPLQVPDYSRFTYWLFGTLSSLGLFGCVLLHELSHCFVAQRLGIPVRQITLFIFGGVSEMAQTHSSSPQAEFKTTIAGPLASLALGGAFLALAIVSKDGAERIVVETFHYLYYVNFLLAAFNLIPGFPLDGGRVLRSILWQRSGDLRKATREASRIGQIIATALMGLGIATILFMHVIPGVWLILIGLFLKKSAETEYQSFELRLGLKDIKVYEIMSPPVAVDRSATISEFLNGYVFRHHSRVFPVVEDGRFSGMIELRSIKGLPSREWNETHVGNFLSSPTTYCVLNPDIEAMDALRILTAQNCDKSAVVRDGTLVGMLTRSDLLELVEMRREIAA